MISTKHQANTSCVAGIQAQTREGRDVASRYPIRAGQTAFRQVTRCSEHLGVGQTSHIGRRYKYSILYQMWFADRGPRYHLRSPSRILPTWLRKAIHAAPCRFR